MASVRMTMCMTLAMGVFMRMAMRLAVRMVAVLVRMRHVKRIDNAACRANRLAAALEKILHYVIALLSHFNSGFSRKVSVSDNRLLLVYDSGLGGLTVYREIDRLLPQTPAIYVADDAAFPYGRLSEEDVVGRVLAVLGCVFDSVRPDVCVIACNTASTSVLPALRSRWPGIDFVGTVPAVKPAAAASRSGMITVLGTSGTVRRDYTRALIREHAAHCDVTLIGSETLAALAEAHMHGGDIDDADIVAELAPCFVERDGRRTDHIVLACTHYPLLQERFEFLAGTSVGWPLTFVDPAPAIARQALAVLGKRPARSDRVTMSPPRQVWLTGGRVDDPEARVFASFGLHFVAGFVCPFDNAAGA